MLLLMQKKVMPHLGIVRLCACVRVCVCSEGNSCEAVSGFDNILWSNELVSPS